MRVLSFTNRNFKELIRDPLSIIFALILPLFLLVIFQQFKIPSEVYNINNFTPGIIIFSYAFISLFTATLVAKDRNTSLLTRLYASPMKSLEYIIGYMLSMLPLIIIQSLLFFIVALLLGLNFSLNILFAILVLIFISLLFIAIGIIIGCVTSEKSASGVGSIVVQLVAFTSGMYFSADMVGKGFNLVCNILPFSMSLKIVKGILNSSSESLLRTSLFLVIYIIIFVLIAIIIFKKKMISDNK